MVFAGARLKLSKKGAAPAMPCIEKNDSRGKPQAGATSLDATEEQSDSEKYRSMRNSSATIHGTHRRKKGMWEAFTVAWYTSQVFCKKL